MDSERHPLEAIIALGERLGIKNLVQSHAGRCWEHQVDEQWWFAINANERMVEATDGAEVPPHHVLIKFNGWPASIFHLGAHEFAFAMGEAANCDTFIAACDRAMEALDHG